MVYFTDNQQEWRVNMPFDGIVVSAIVSELNNHITNGKIEKIYQPEADEIHMLIRCGGKNYRLLISASSSHPRIHFTTINKTNPETPPMFCMLMRKHIQGGKILKIQQKEFERIIIMDIESFDELGHPTIKQLIVEIMGKHSNIILIDKEQKKIIDSIKRIHSALSRYREILPGRQYIEPPDQNKKNPFDLKQANWTTAFLNNFTPATPIYKVLYLSLQGLSPLAAREICYRAGIDGDTSIVRLSEENYHLIWKTLQELVKNIENGEFTPNIFLSKKDRAVVDFHCIPLLSLESVYDISPVESISKMLESFYWKKDQSNRIKQQSIDLNKFATQKINKLYKKLQKLQEELIDAEQSQKYRTYGELLTAHLHLIQPGDEKIEVVNYYSNNGERITIPLVPTLSPAKNAQNYFKKYNKAKTALKEKKIQLEETEKEIQYFENLLHAIENVSTLQDIEEIREELIEEGYLKKRKNKISNKKKDSAPKPMSFISSDGFQILVGKNNRQNDLLTLKIASKKDLWFHAKNIPGSHVVIISNQLPIPQQTILEAGELAAFYSKAKLSSNVPVDYTKIKNVKKPNGAKPGMVIYENYKTIFVTPRPNIEEILSDRIDRSK